MHFLHDIYCLLKLKLGPPHVQPVFATPVAHSTYEISHDTGIENRP
jgi:hypothetical protein